MPIPLRSRAATALAALSLLAAAACAGESDASSAVADTGGQVAVATPSAGAASAAPAAATSGAPRITVYKSPTCGCCTAWEEHMKENGFEVDSRPTNDMAAIKTEHRIGREHESCHTGIVDGYVIEGHVPADLVAKLLTERPEGVVALSVPGMPMGSPGMEGVYKQAYQVLAIDRDGKATVFAER